MVPAPGSLRLDEPGLFRAYDKGSVERGIRYAAEGRVELVELDDGWALGRVQGTRPAPYVVDVEWTRAGRQVRTTDDCSCPLGGGCKHAVALIVEVTRAFRPTAPASIVRGRQPGIRGQGGVAGGAWGSDTGALSRRSWRAALSGIGSDLPLAVTLLALQFTVATPRVGPGGRTAATEVLVRPVRRGTSGKWVRSGAGWRDVVGGHGWDLRDADPEQLAALRAVGVGANLSAYGSDNGPLPLARFGPAVWSALRRAADAGVGLVDALGRERVVLADDAATVAVDLVGTDDGGVEVRPGFRRDGRPVELVPGVVGTVGSPPHGLYVVHDEQLELVPLDRPVHAGLAPLVGGPPVVVPPADVDEFLDEFTPRLGRVAPVASPDGSVTVEPVRLDRLVAVVERRAVDEARLTWSARYRRGGRITDHPLVHPFGTGRDRLAERTLADELELPTHLLGGLRDALGRPAALDVRGHDAVVLLTQVLPWLTGRDQVAVELTGDAPELREATDDPLIELDVTEPDEGDGRTDWFDLSVTVTVDGEDVPFAALFRALSLDEPVLILASGTWLRLDRPELDRLRELIEEARGLAEPVDDHTVRINRFQVSWWDELTALGVVGTQAQRWAEDVARMGELTAPEPVQPSPRLAATLRHYQQEGLDWLAFLHANRLGGILADDMGLGKTVQTLALFLHVLDRRPDARFLVVAPTSVVENWHREAARFAPGVPVATVSGTAARRGCDLAAAVGDARIVVTSYALLRLEFDAYQELGWDLLVLDEAQFVKNHRSKTYQCVRRLDATTKLAITGTPLENSLMDLWSLLSITAPGLYPDPQRFGQVYRRPIESGRAPELLATLRRRIAPLMRRRTKDEVLTELPPKTEQTVEVELGTKHMRIYQSQLQRQRQKVLGLVDDVQRHRFEILRSLTVLRQLSLDPALVDAEHEGVGSAKLDRLVEDLSQVVAEGHRALVFSQFTRFLARVRSRLDDAGIDHAYLDGRTRNRDAAIARFKDGDAPVFVISLKAGGFGLNLTEADYCFVLDPWWNPAAETQAVDRTHRIGQLNPVVVYRYVSAGTIEEKVMELKARKSALFDSVVDADGALAGALGAEDLRALFEPG